MRGSSPPTGQIPRQRLSDVLEQGSKLGQLIGDGLVLVPEQARDERPVICEVADVKLARIDLGPVASRSRYFPIILIFQCDGSHASRFDDVVEDTVDDRLQLEEVDLGHWPRCRLSHSSSCLLKLS